MYRYTYRLSNGEYWRLSMYYTYGSMVGVCNLIFTAALFILTYVKWGGAGWGYRAMLIFRLQSVYRASASGDLETFQKDCFSDYERGYSYHD